MDSERIIRDLAAALPKAFEGHDLVKDYYSDWGEPDQRWLPYIAVADARMWIEDHALSIDVLRRVQDVFDYAGPHTRAVMGRAQEHLAWCSDAVGRWPA